MFWADIPSPVSHLEGDREFEDSPLEGAGFELLVPLRAWRRLRWPNDRECLWRALATTPFSERDRGFESCLLRRRVHCEPDFLRLRQAELADMRNVMSIISPIAWRRCDNDGRHGD